MKAAGSSPAIHDTDIKYWVGWLMRWVGWQYVELFALFEPQFGRRPYFHEAEGSVVVLTDRSLEGRALRLTATLPGGVEVGPAPAQRTIVAEGVGWIASLSRRSLYRCRGVACKGSDC